MQFQRVLVISTQHEKVLMRTHLGWGSAPLEVLCTFTVMWTWASPFELASCGTVWCLELTTEAG